MARKYTEGFQKAQATFKGISEKSAKKIAVALNKSAAEIKDRAELLVPVDTGDLRRDIQIETTEPVLRKDGRALVARVIAGTRRENAQAAFRTEFGRRPGPDGHPGHPAASWFFTAYQSVRKRVRGRIKRAVNAAAREAARGGQ